MSAPTYSRRPVRHHATVGFVTSGVLMVLFWIMFGGTWSFFSWVFCWLVAINVVAFAYYAYDKRRAGQSGNRVPEVVLHALALGGGSLCSLLVLRVFGRVDEPQRPRALLLLVESESITAPTRMRMEHAPRPPAELARRLARIAAGHFRLVVLAKHVADVLAQEALDALAELLHAVDVALLHPPRTVRRVGGPRLESRDLLLDPEVPRDVRDQVLDRRKRAHRLDAHRFVQVQRAEPSHAHQARLAVNLR